jgi:hypothetical protein
MIALVDNKLIAVDRRMRGAVKLKRRSQALYNITAATLDRTSRIQDHCIRMLNLAYGLRVSDHVKLIHSLNDITADS